MLNSTEHIKFQLLIESKILKKMSCLRYSDVIILLINVKISTNVGQSGRAQLVESLTGDEMVASSSLTISGVTLVCP